MVVYGNTDCLSNKYDNLEPISKTDKPSFIVVTALLPKK
jgi:hypothetical protein